MEAKKYTTIVLWIFFMTSLITEAQNIQNKILFSRHFFPDDSIFSINPDGTGIQFITIGYGPVPSTDGHWLLFLRGGYPDISVDNLWIRDCVLHHDTMIYYNDDHISGYTFAKSNTQIVFDYECSMNKINPDGSNFIGYFLQGSDCYDDNPNIRTRDSLIVFHNKNNGLYTANYDGTGRGKIPNTQYNDLSPNWSPNGNWISFGRGLGYPDYTTHNYYKIKADGSGLTQLTFFDTTAMLTFGGSWSADSSSILVAGKVDSVSRIWAAVTNGTNSRSVVYTNQSPHDIDFVYGSNVTGTSGIDQVQVQDNELFIVYPNPVKNQFTLQFHAKEVTEVTATLFDASGKAVKQLLNTKITAGLNHYTINTNSLIPGNYLIQVKTATVSAVKKITILP